MRRKDFSQALRITHATKEKDGKNIAFCGLICSECQVFIATHNKDREQVESFVPKESDRRRAPDGLANRQRSG